MPSPVRRSARAAPPASVTSSTSSNRQDRNASAPNNQQKSVTPHSLSSEELSEPPRRSKRAHPLVDTDVQKQEVDEDAVEDEEEVTRCLCGQQEYPGLPLSEAFSSTEAQSEDAGGLFIQCDGCSVWQHGGCVGIVDESQSPDKYYCELCRPKQHEVHTDTNGQRYSLYLPITSKFTQRKTSMSKGSDDKVKRERADTASRASADPLTGKRRGTIRSREHDEEAEQIQRAIEESAREAQGGKRSGKRSREESSDDLKQENKRQRRASETLPSINRAATLEDESEDEYGDSTTSRVKKARAEAAQVARQAEQREKDKEREKARAEAAGRRQERAGRRRGDDDPEDANNPTRSGSQSPPASSQPNSPSSFAAPEKTFPQRRAPGKKVKKLGNNQYTKNRVEHAAASSPHNRKRLLTSGGTSSGDEQAPHSDMAVPSGTPSAQEGPVNGNVGKGRWAKGKKLNGHAFRHITSEPMEATIPNMARNLEGMMAYIQKSQLDHADDGLRGGGDGSPTAGISPADGTSAMELAEQLTKGIREWQERYRPQDSVRA
ncbi:hypothetical protein AMS68_000296 [Peltaster fructicola]|uniref:Zinc finger PHD-type domain-containing protein n=1 Tax=Peltaster fructicola TaxID=286661 RepID=A0A6H0XJG5_9PEZI|nr:hypothetical protein AMS68_000296 [Peltaster fructicola]